MHARNLPGPRPAKVHLMGCWGGIDDRSTKEKVEISATWINTCGRGVLVCRVVACRYQDRHFIDPPLAARSVSRDTAAKHDRVPLVSITPLTTSRPLRVQFIVFGLAPLPVHVSRLRDSAPPPDLALRGRIDVTADFF